MASPAFATESLNQGSGTSFTMTAPSGSADGDILYCQILVEAGFTSFSGPAGWNLEFGPIDVTDFSVWIYTIRRSGAPSMGVSWSGSKYWEWMIGRFTGAVSSGDYVDVKASGTPGAYTTLTPPPVTISSAETIVIVSAAHWAGYDSKAGPAGYTQFCVGVFLDTKGAWLQVAAAGTQTPGAFESPGSSANAWASTLVLRSVGGGGGAVVEPTPLQILQFGSNF